MTDSYLQQTPLAAFGLAARAAREAGRTDTGLTLREHAFRGMILLRGDPDRHAFRNTVAGVLGAPLPIEPNTVVGPADLTQGPRVLWLGPDEWLVVTAPTKEKILLGDLEKALAAEFATALDMSDTRAAIGMEGAHAREALMKGCTVDLHPDVFQPGRCAQTLLGRASVLIHCTAADSFDIYVARSFAEYLWAWVEDAALEFGVKVGA